MRSVRDEKMKTNKKEMGVVSRWGRGVCVFLVGRGRLRTCPAFCLIPPRPKEALLPPCGVCFCVREMTGPPRGPLHPKRNKQKMDGMDGMKAASLSLPLFSLRARTAHAHLTHTTQLPLCHASHVSRKKKNTAEDGNTNKRGRGERVVRKQTLVRAFQPIQPPHAPTPRPRHSPGASPPFFYKRGPPLSPF